MNTIGAPAHDAVPIGEVSAPPFARLPDPSTMFRLRAARFRHIAASGHDLAPYLNFLAGLADAQHAAACAGLPAPLLPAADERARSIEYGMPALDRTLFASDPTCAATVERVLAGAAAQPMPEAAREALVRVEAASPDIRAWMAGTVLDDAIPAEEVAEHVIVAAGLQVHAARAASALDVASLRAVGDGLCPACGSAPVSSAIVGWDGANGARFCACSLCATMWNAVRIRCTACGETGGISYRELDGSDGQIKAECCGTCRTYLKVLAQTKNPGLDPVADDVATAALDLLVSEDGVRRGGRNPFLLGY